MRGSRAAARTTTASSPRTPHFSSACEGLPCDRRARTRARQDRRRDAPAERCRGRQLRASSTTSCRSRGADRWLTRNSRDSTRTAPDAGPMLERAGVRLARADCAARIADAAETGPAAARRSCLRAHRARARRSSASGWPHDSFAAGDASRPCGDCPDCRLFLAGSHPDYRWISVLKDKKEISIDQMRALSEALSLRSYRGGVKVAVIAPAEAMSLKAFNALLKTLEEPADETYLVLAASRIDRIPKTIMSRTMRLRLPLPAETEALAWLSNNWLPTKPGRRSCARGWRAVPRSGLRRRRASASSMPRCRRRLPRRSAGRLDLVAFADACAEKCPGSAARLARILANAELEGGRPG